MWINIVADWKFWRKNWSVSFLFSCTYDYSIWAVYNMVSRKNRIANIYQFLLCLRAIRLFLHQLFSAGSKKYCFFCSVMYILNPFSIYVFRAENGLKNAKSKSTGIISSKNTVAGQKDLTKWPNVLGPTLQSLVTLLAFQQKLKREKSNLSVQTVLPQEKKLKL